MAVTTQYSTEYDKGYITQSDKLQTTEAHGRVRMAYFVHDQSGAGDATSSVAIVKLPPGRVRVLGKQSNVYVNWTTASATLDAGWDAYTDLAGDAVAADPNGLDDGVSVETAGNINLGSALAASGYTKVFESQDGVVLRLTSQDTAIAAGDDAALAGLAVGGPRRTPRRRVARRGGPAARRHGPRRSAL